MAVGNLALAAVPGVLVPDRVHVVVSATKKPENPFKKVLGLLEAPVAAFQDSVCRFLLPWTAGQVLSSQPLGISSQQGFNATLLQSCQQCV